MKRILYIILLALLPALMGGAKASAQDNGVNSPFSRYGVGLLSQNQQGFNSGMAGLSYALHDGRQLNAGNPASYSTVDSLAFIFDMGVSLQNGNFVQNKAATNARNASFDYVAMGFRLHKGLGMSLGLRPISNIGYKLQSVGATIDGGITGDIIPTVNYSGAGGLHEAYAGWGYSPYFGKHHPISLGVNVGFLWGSVTHVANNVYTDAAVQSLSRAYNASLRSYNLNAGMQYEQKFGKVGALTLGATYHMGHDLSGKSYFYNQRISSNIVLAADTLIAHKAWSLPHTFGAGIAWQQGNSLRVGADYTRSLWSKARQPLLVQKADGTMQYEGSTAGYSDSQRFTIGAEYVADPDGLSWAKRVRYRAGFSMADSYALVDGKDGPRSYLVSLGASFPIINLYNNRTFLNVAAQLERTAPTVPGQLRETYIRLCLGITFGERWFQKWMVQ